MKSVSTLLLISLALTTFYGCAPVVVGGAAAGGSALHDRRTVGTFVDDQGIELKARLAILENKELNSQIHASVTSFNGVVLLLGTGTNRDSQAAGTGHCGRYRKGAHGAQ